MKFEIDPNKLTTDQRAHVAAFITNWPNRYNRDREDELYESLVKNDQLIPRLQAEGCDVTEEQRLDAEQKRDLDEARDIGAAQAVNLNAIFGEPKSSAVPLDSQGLPWDSRIHASTKTFIADGSWKLRRGVDPAEVEKVKAQLKELMEVPTTPAPVLTPTSVGYVPAPTIIPQLAEVTGNAGVPTPPAPKSHYLIDQQPATVTLTDLIGRMSAAITAGKLTQASIAEICSKHGVSEFHLLSNRPDLLPLIDADMKAMGV